MDTQKKLGLLTELFELDEGILTAETVLADLDNWDSMMKLSLIVLMDDECKKKLSGSKIKEFITIQDVMDFME
ncbi:MAG: hypothetical protein RR547_11465 [Raoultibacter sp.]